ncbi:MAG: Kazal-type serine protease inhibitor domain-containing protein [Sandaracinaceae bacterium]
MVFGLSMAALGCEGGSGDGRDAGVVRACEATGLSCESDEYCDRGGRCAGPGRCVARPATCDGAGGPMMCGCNGVTYPTECDLRLDGASIEGEGACP